MGFNRQQVERAINENTTYSRDNQSRYIQRLVAWLIDRPTSDVEDTASDSDDTDDVEDMLLAYESEVSFFLSLVVSCQSKYMKLIRIGHKGSIMLLEEESIFNTSRII